MTFELIEKKYLKNINTNAYLYEHVKTCARLVFFENDDTHIAIVYRGFWHKAFKARDYIGK